MTDNPMELWGVNWATFGDLDAERDDPSYTQDVASFAQPRILDCLFSTKDEALTFGQAMFEAEERDMAKAHDGDPESEKECEEILKRLRVEDRDTERFLFDGDEVHAVISAVRFKWHAKVKTKPA